MFMIIDNSEDGKILLTVLDKKIVQEIVYRSDRPDLLVSLDKAFSKMRAKLKDLKGLGVVVGAGRFTATRLAVTMANTLAYSLNIPVVALPKNWDAAKAFKNIRQAKPGRYALPKYSGEAHIGGKN
jgi:tRNA A37 threonylcarbamoyladenosine modification protein TsaB